MKVIDTGKGLTEDELKDLFNFENTSLYNCKLLIEQMGGNITVDTKLGHGTSYSINFKTVSKVNTNEIGQNLHKKCKQNGEIDNPLMPGFLD
jgi:K+-sensing histidine kinase KdpD